MVGGVVSVFAPIRLDSLLCRSGIFPRLRRLCSLGENGSRASRHRGWITRTMSRKIASYIHPQRRRWGLSQQELAYLIGLKSGSNISRFEREGRNPTVTVAFACQILFGSSASDLFPGLYGKVEEAFMRRAYKLHERLGEDQSKKGQAKRRLLQEALSRAKRRANEQEV